MALLVHAEVGPSSIQGLGLIAKEFIAAGTVVWEFNPQIDLVLTEKQLNSLPPATLRQMKKYTYRCMDSDLFVLCGDDSRHMNHAQNSNTHSGTGAGPEGQTIASRDIEVGEELTTNYFEYDAESRDKLAFDAKIAP